MTKKDSPKKVNGKNKRKAAGGLKNHATLEFLLRRMHHTKDFPAFSKHLVEINQKASAAGGNYASASELANTILKDFSVTNKLLRLVNSAYYGSLTGNVTTVSRAVVVLGFEQVRVAAASIMLFEHLSNTEQRKELQEEIIQSFLSGVVARKLAELLGMDGLEEAFICSMLHNLGKVLVIFYLPKEYKRIKALLAKDPSEEGSVSKKVLGLSYREIGKGVVVAWKFPSKIVSSMDDLPAGKVPAPRSEGDSLMKLSSFSNTLCRIVMNPDGRDRHESMRDLLERFSACYSISIEKIQDTLSTSVNQAKKYSDVFNLNLHGSKFEKGLASLKNEGEGYKKSKTQPVQARPVGYEPEEVGPYEIASPLTAVEDPQEILVSGIEDISNLLTGNYTFRDLLTIILETIYRGFCFDRVLFCMVNNRQTKMIARLGFGKDVEEIIREFSFPLEDKSNVFGLSLALQKDIRIDDTRDPRIKKKIPEWYRRTLFAPAFILFPVHVDGRPQAFLYADRDKPGKVIDDNQLNYMRILKNQAVLALKLKH